MFRFSTRRFVLPTSTRVKQYIDHLYPREGKELLPMIDIMPNANDGMASSVEFQKLFLEIMSSSPPIITQQSGFPMPQTPENSKSPAGWVCTLPGDGLLRNMGHHDTIFSPLPGNLVTIENNNSSDTPLAFSKKKRRIQSLEMTLAVQLDEASISGPNPTIAKVAPAILLRGSRYQFYAPHSPGFAADLSSACHLIIGGGGKSKNNSNNNSNSVVVPGIDYSSLNFSLEGMGTVLTQGIEPISVGYIQRFHLVDTVQAVCQYIHSNFESSSDDFLREKCGGNGGTGKGNWWIATGCLARVPAAVGEYRANFGLLGDVKIMISP